MKKINIKKYGLFLGVFIIVFFGLSLVFIFGKDVSKKNKSTINQKEQPVKNESLNTEAEIIFAGDLMFDRYIREVSNRKGNDFIFEKITDYLQKSDLVVANLEGPITDKSSKSIGSEFESPENYIFTFNSSLVPTLKKNKIKLVNLGNNHILNFGKNGLEQTINNLKNYSVKYFGDTGSNLSGEEYLVTKINDINFGFINFNQFSQKSSEKTLENIKKIKEEADFIIVYTHWGKEYENKSNINQRNLAHSFVDQGADLIIGSHPHVTQEKEIYKDKIIYYSLGNFVFDQYFEEETKKGLLVKIRFNKKDGLKIVEEKNVFMVNNGQTVFNKK